MRVEVTLVDPLRDMRSDVVIDADDTSATGEVLDDLLGMLAGRRAPCTVHRLTMGEATIGSDPGCVIALSDDRVPPVCVTMSVTADGTATVRPAAGGSTVLAETVPPGQ